jgi:hypothetical protein
MCSHSVVAPPQWLKTLWNRYSPFCSYISLLFYLAAAAATVVPSSTPLLTKLIPQRGRSGFYTSLLIFFARVLIAITNFRSHTGHRLSTGTTCGMAVSEQTCQNCSISKLRQNKRVCKYLTMKLYCVKAC